MRWNHRVWETDRATRLDRMGSPAKWMREHYRPPLPFPFPPSREQGLVWAARTCPSKLHFLFSALAKRIASPPPPSPFPFPVIDFSGEKSVENSIMRFQSAATYLLPAHYAKIPSTDALTPKMSIYLFSDENLMARVKSDY